MSDQNVFETKETTQETPEQTTQSSTNVFADQLASIKNERGEPKYGSVEEALKGASHAQDYIAQLKNEIETLRNQSTKTQADLESRQSIEELVSRLTAKEEPQIENTPQPVGLDEAAIAKLLEAKLAEREQSQTNQSNVSQVQAALVSKFGDKTQEMVIKKAQELGTTPEQIGVLAQSSPKMVLALFDTAPTSNQPKATLGSQQVPSDYAKADELERPTKSLLSGATSKEQAEYMRLIKERVYQQHGITQ